MTRFLAFGLVLAAFSPARSAAANPWDLRCPSMPAEQPVPAPLRAAVHAFTPWGSSADGVLVAGPVYVFALSNHTAISRDGDPDTSNGYLHRTLVAIAPSYTGALLLRGSRLGKPGPRTVLGFSTNGASRCAVTKRGVECGSPPLRFASSLLIGPGAGWRIVRTELQIGRTGCFRITVVGRGLHEVVPLAVPGPD